MHLPIVLANSFVEVRPALILRLKAWGPILAVVEEREKQIASSIDAAKRERAEAEKLLAEQKTAIAEARRESQEMLRRNQQDVEKFRDDLMAKSRKEAEEFKASAQREIQDQKAKAIAEVKAMTVDLSIEIASKLLNERLDDAKHRAMAEQFMKGLPAKGPEQRS